MSKYCPKCRQNFSDSFDECVYCNTPLVNGQIEIEDTSTTEIHTMSDSEILEKYKNYRKTIENQIGRELSDTEFLIGLKEARRDSLVLKEEKYNKTSTSEKNVPKCQHVKAQTSKKCQQLQKLVQNSCGVYYHKKSKSNGIVIIVVMNGNTYTKEVAYGTSRNYASLFK